MAQVSRDYTRVLPPGERTCLLCGNPTAIVRYGKTRRPAVQCHVCKSTLFPCTPEAVTGLAVLMEIAAEQRARIDAERVALEALIEVS